MHSFPAAFRAAAAVAVIVVLAVSCGGGGTSTTATTQPVATPQSYAERGPYAVGATRLALDPARPVEVFYPADRGAVPADARGYRYTPEEVWGDLLAALPPGVVSAVSVPDAWFDVPASTGRFPIVVISHGVGMMRFSYLLHAAHLASWGYVVASPEQPVRDLHARLGGRDTSKDDPATLLDTVRLLQSEAARAGGALEGRVDTDRVAVEGHSAGGRDAALAAYDPVVDTWIALAPSVPVPAAAAGGHDIIREGEYGLDPAAGELDLAAFLATATPPDKPSMMLVADRDVVFPVAERRTVFDWLTAPKRYVVLSGTGHTVFVNDCAAIQDNGESKIAKALGFDPASIERRLLENGCLPADSPVRLVRATWDHLAVAQLNWVFDIDRAVAAASLERSYLDQTFPGRIAEYVAVP